MKLDYIDIVQTITRLTDVLGASWNWHVLDSTITFVRNEDGGGSYLASVRGELRITLADGVEVIRGGVGADVDGRDPDKAIKTADAEALKKAGHKFGIALYLWDEGKRNEIAAFRELSRGSVGSLQKALVERYGVDQAKEIGSGKSREELLALLAA